MAGAVVVPDDGCQGQDALHDADQDSGRGVPAVLFEVELPFECLVDRFDDLAQWLEELGTGPFWLAFAGRPQQAQACLAQGGFELSAEVVLVPDDELTGPVGGRGLAGEDVEQHLAFVGLGAGEAKPTGSPCRVHSRCSRSPQK